MRKFASSINNVRFFPIEKIISINYYFYEKNLHYHQIMKKVGCSSVTIEKYLLNNVDEWIQYKTKNNNEFSKIGLE